MIHLFKTFQAKKFYTPVGPATPTEYKPYENEYFKVEIPVNWKEYPGSETGTTPDYLFINETDRSMLSVRLGLDGASLSPQPGLENFNETGYLNEGPFIHFLETFQHKPILRQ